MGLNIVWLECVINEKNIGSTHKIVNYKTAARQGEPFEEMIKKYGIPNMAYPHCTRELKLAPIYSYLKTIKLDKYEMAIGLRADEKRRAIQLADRGNIIYPLIDRWPTNKIMVNNWWQDQEFTLTIDEYEGNCVWCWKKSMKKHLALLTSQPECFDFPLRMERQYPLSGHNTDGTPRTFFRGGMSAKDLIEIHEEERTTRPCLVFDIKNDDSESCDIHAKCDVEKCSGF